MQEVSKWHCEKTTEITVNGSRKILNLIPYPGKDFQVRSSIQSHLEWSQLDYCDLMQLVIKCERYKNGMVRKQQM